VLFQKRPDRKHNELGVNLFYAWLEKSHAELPGAGLEDLQGRLCLDLERSYE
jgi:hypothetical protein